MSVYPDLQCACKLLLMKKILKKTYGSDNCTPYPHKSGYLCSDYIYNFYARHANYAQIKRQILTNR